MSEKIQGSCLCGQVRFELESNFSQFHLCHCEQCQKMSGSAHASNLFTAPDNIHWLSGETLIKRYNVPGRKLSNVFCAECGCRVPYLSQSGKALVVPAGCLDGDPKMQANDNIFWEERASWYDEALCSEKFAGFPAR